ncbi:MAG: hypothetical protein NY202_03425 [Mollicutes bacterium UO1]
MTTTLNDLLTETVNKEERQALIDEINVLEASVKKLNEELLD